jgi:hypothetical protein
VPVSHAVARGSPQSATQLPDAQLSPAAQTQAASCGTNASAPESGGITHRPSMHARPLAQSLALVQVPGTGGEAQASAVETESRARASRRRRIDREGTSGGDHERATADTMSA